MCVFLWHFLLFIRHRIERHTTHQTNWPKCDLTLGGSSKVVEVKVSVLRSTVVQVLSDKSFWRVLIKGKNRTSHSTQLSTFYCRRIHKTEKYFFDVDWCLWSWLIDCISQVVSRECPGRCVSPDHVPTWDTWVLAATHRALEVRSPTTGNVLNVDRRLRVNVRWIYLWLAASGQTMAPRPSMGVPGPRSIPPYKYATSVRNPNPQVVQPIAMQQVWSKVNMYRQSDLFRQKSCSPRSSTCVFRLSQLCTFRARSLSPPPCSLPRLHKSRNRCWVRVMFDYFYFLKYRITWGKMRKKNLKKMTLL